MSNQWHNKKDKKTDNIYDTTGRMTIPGTNYTDRYDGSETNRLYIPNLTNYENDQNNNTLTEGCLYERQKLYVHQNYTPSPIMNNSNIQKYGTQNLDKNAFIVQNSLNTNRYNEYSCYIKGSQAILNRHEATRFLDDFLNTRTIQVRYMQDLGIDNNVNSVEYRDSFFNYNGIYIGLISLNCSNSIESRRYVYRYFNDSPKYYVGDQGIESAAFYFGGWGKQQGTTLQISVIYSDRNKFIELFKI